MFLNSAPSHILHILFSSWSIDYIQYIQTEILSNVLGVFIISVFDLRFLTYSKWVKYILAHTANNKSNLKYFKFYH